MHRNQWKFPASAILVTLVDGAQNSYTTEIVNVNVELSKEEKGVREKHQV